jgi:hypothetical protein
MSKHRAAIALSLTALAVAVLGQTPIGHAAVSTVRVALFAQNSAKVNNIQASRKPMPGRLLALNSKAQLPASVLPARSTGQEYTHTIVVHPDPDFRKAGSALIRAVATIAGNSASNPYLVKVEPGVYDVGDASVAMKEYVDVEGSGEDVTTITSTNSSGAGTVVGANHSELRYAMVTNTGSGQQSVALFAESTSPRFTNVTAMSSGGSENYGVHLSNGSAVLKNVTAAATGGATAIGLANFNGNITAANSSFTASDAAGLVVGVLTTYGGSVKLQSSDLTAAGGSVAMGMRSYNGNHTLANVTVTASSSGESFGIYNGQKTSGPTVQVTHSKVSAQTNSVFVLGGWVRLGASQITGPVATQDLGTARCVYVYDGSFNPLAGCP